MGIKPDHWIRKMSLENKMIEPFVEKQTTNGAISYGVSSYGYDIRVSNLRYLQMYITQWLILKVLMRSLL